jgi:hypothetical protein
MDQWVTENITSLREITATQVRQSARADHLGFAAGSYADGLGLVIRGGTPIDALSG